MATLTVTDLGAFGGGATQTLTAVSSSDSFANDERTFLVVTNASGGNLTVTFDCPIDSNYGASGADADVALTQATGTTVMYGPFAKARYSGTLTVGFSTTSSVTANPFRLPKATLTV